MVHIQLGFIWLHGILSDFSFFQSPDIMTSSSAQPSITSGCHSNRERLTPPSHHSLRWSKILFFGGWRREETQESMRGQGILRTSAPQWPGPHWLVGSANKKNKIKNKIKFGFPFLPPDTPFVFICILINSHVKQLLNN